jgi:hypothetical protein
LTSSCFSFNGQFYEQTDGVAMGSPLSPVIANYFMGYFEEMALEAATHKPLCWFRYVDDIFHVWRATRVRTELSSARQEQSVRVAAIKSVN